MMGERISKTKTRTKIFAVVLIGVMVLGSYFAISGWQLSTSTGYQTAFQGMQAEFSSIKWNGSYWSSTESSTADWSPSSNFFGYEMNFDPDTVDEGWCNLMASQQPILVNPDRRFTGYPYTWSVDAGTVTLEDGTTATKSYQFAMDKVECEWKVNIWLSGSGAEAADWTAFNIITNEPNYGGTELWLRLTPATFSYFADNPDELYIAPAYIGLVEPAVYTSTDQDGKIVLNDADMSAMDINPSATGETLGIYYARGGSSADVEGEILSYKGIALDPQVFRDEYWIHVDLVNFKPTNWFDWQLWHKYKYPSVTLTFQATLFVVGEWTVYLESGEVPDLEPHTAPSSTKGVFDDLIADVSGFFGGIGDWWDNPLNQVGVWLMIGVGVLVVLAIFVPTVLTMIFSGAGKAVSGVSGAVKSAKKKRRKKKSKRKT
ncbi:MAG: hypothetical protein ACOWW1_05585 [archaeon]